MEAGRSSTETTCGMIGAGAIGERSPRANYELQVTNYERRGRAPACRDSPEHGYRKHRLGAEDGWPVRQVRGRPAMKG